MTPGYSDPSQLRLCCSSSGSGHHTYATRSLSYTMRQSIQRQRPSARGTTVLRTYSKQYKAYLLVQENRWERPRLKGKNPNPNPNPPTCKGKEPKLSNYFRPMLQAKDPSSVWDGSNKVAQGRYSARNRDKIMKRGDIGWRGQRSMGRILVW